MAQDKQQLLKTWIKPVMIVPKGEGQRQDGSKWKRGTITDGTGNDERVFFTWNRDKYQRGVACEVLYKHEMNKHTDKLEFWLVEPKEKKEKTSPTVDKKLDERLWRLETRMDSLEDAVKAWMDAEEENEPPLEQINEDLSLNDQIPDPIPF